MERNQDHIIALGKAVWRHYRRRCATRVARAIKEGYLKSLSDGETKCGYCGVNPALVYEHRDYSDPFLVTPSCDPCNHTLPTAMLPISVVLSHLSQSEDFPFSNTSIRREWFQVDRDER
jgi:hypothetical protein